MGTFASYIGNVIIPEERKAEFNNNMIKLLQNGGMVTFNRVSLYGKDISLISPVVLNEEGKCYFYYNYFEDDSWEDAGFDSNSGMLWSNKIGSAEFNYVICAGYFLTELYSEDYGWVSENGDTLNNPEYIQWINYIADKDFSLEKRFDLWKYYESYVLNEMKIGYKIEEISVSDALSFVPKCMEEYMGGTELVDIFYIANGTEKIDENACWGAYVKDISALKELLEKFYKTHPQNGKELLWQLITMPIDKRENIRECDYAELAKFSTKIAARVFVYLSAEIMQFAFWDEWKKIYKDVYSDEVSPQYVSDRILAERKKHRTATLGKIKTSKFLRNDNYFTFYDTPEEIRHKENYYISDDDLMYWWDETEKIQISEKMKNKIYNWKKEYDEILRNITPDEINNYDMLKKLMDVLKSADNYYKRIFAFNDMFYEFLENGKNAKYVAVVELFRKIVEDNKKDGKIIEYARDRWTYVSKNVTFNEGRVTIKRFLSLMANKKIRKIYFDF